MKLYCGLDVILLAEVFVKYREIVLHHFKLDPIYYLGTFIIYIVTLFWNFFFSQAYPVYPSTLC